MLNGLAGTSDAKERLEGYKQALAEKGIVFNPAWVRMGCFNPETGYRAMKPLLMEVERPTAVFCFSDYVAMGVIGAIKEQRLEIPGDMAVVGFDDIEFAEYLAVPLTTIRNPQYHIGVEATKLLLGIIEEDIEEPQQIVLTPELVLRVSC
jgi:DNA-binding LacI/PurR family transcriptional regulator